MKVQANRSLCAFAAAALMLTLALAGCGGGDDEDQPSSITKAQFVKQADEICAATEKEQRKLLTKFQQENKNAKGGPQLTEEMITSAAIPPLEKQAEKFAELPSPDKEAAKAEAYAEAVEKAIRDVKKEPGTLLAEPGAFEKAEDMAPGFGFKVCRGA